MKTVEIQVWHVLGLWHVKQYIGQFTQIPFDKNVVYSHWLQVLGEEHASHAIPQLAHTLFSR